MNCTRLRWSTLVVVLAAMTLAGSPALSQETLTLDQLMTADEQARFGMVKLSNAERAELERWITMWTRYVAEYTEQKAGVEVETAYPGVGSGHWVAQVSQRGRTVRLNDLSEWEISSDSQHKVAGWQPTTQVTVLESDQPNGEYAYVLVNRMEDEVAYARYKGRK